jgi:hypothetical protein
VRIELRLLIGPKQTRLLFLLVAILYNSSPLLFRIIIEVESEFFATISGKESAIRSLINIGGINGMSVGKPDNNIKSWLKA